MERTSWKLAVAAALAAALTACGTKAPEGPLFANGEPVAAAKPDEFAFKHTIRVGALQGLDETVRRNLTVILRPEDIADSLRRSLANDEMLASVDTEAEYELTPVFVDLRTAPVNGRITAAQAVLDYRVVRLGDGATVFNRRVKSEFSSIADPNFGAGGMVGRTLRFVGLRKPAPPPPAAASGPDEARAPGPQREAAREIHAARNAVALNIRTALRRLVAASPERLLVTSAGSDAPGADHAGADAPGTDDQRD